MPHFRRVRTFGGPFVAGTALAVARGVELIASRFLTGGTATIDLARAREARLRCLPRCEAADERRWTDACARLSRLWHEDMPPLLDHGFTPEGRFEAYGILRPTGARRVLANLAVQAFLSREAPSDDGCPAPDAKSRRAPGSSERPRLGMRLLAPAPLVAVTDILDERRSASPLDLLCLAEPGAGASTFLQMAAVEARKRGYVPLSVCALEQRADLAAALRHRTVLLLCDSSDSHRAAHRWLLHLTTLSARSHVLLRIGPRALGNADIVLRLEPFASAALADSVHVHPAALDQDDVRRAAVRSGGLPGRFLDQLRGVEQTRWGLRVAEARPAYGPCEDTQAQELEHPWGDLIANAGREWMRGRRVAAERDLRQIAGAARRREMAIAAATAEVTLAERLGARGRIADARELLAGCAETCRGSDALATRAALAVGALHLEDGALEAAESAYRACRALDPERASIGLTRTLCWQGRYEEAESAIARARDSVDSGIRSATWVLLGTVSLGLHDLPAAARAGTQALSAAQAQDGFLRASAAELLMMVHARLGDHDAVEQYARRALEGARAGGSTGAVLALRAEILDAQHRCGREPDRRRLERLMALAVRSPALTRARLWAVAARIHPSLEMREKFEERLRAFVRATGARALLPECQDPAGAALARDVAALLAVQETARTPREVLQGAAAWIRERLDARAVAVCDVEAVALVRAGPGDSMPAARRVMTTRMAQPPWASSEAIEAAVLIRHAGLVRGALAARWPLSRCVSAAALPLMTAAASIIGPALAELSDRQPARATASDGMIGRSGAIQRLRDLVSRAAPSPFPVVIEGESGAGKELVARAIHQASPRRLRACVAINCAALTEDLLEAELFGHARGAFTGALADRAGLFEQADGGTLFLDEIGELSARAQAKLLRVLQDGEVRRLGENLARKVDVRIVAASNRVLQAEVDAGRFRSDLLFRLAVLRISVPPLRERAEDIPLLAAHYWEDARARAGSRAVLTTSATARLAQHNWPGNVRELQNVIAGLAVHVPRGRVEAGHVAVLIDNSAASEGMEGQGITLDEARRVFERQFVCAAIARCGGRQTDTARRLGISRQGLAKLVKRLGISDGNHTDP